MLFNSIDFAVFLPIVLILYWLIPKNNCKHQNILVLLSSYVFYGWWNWRFLFLIIFTSLIDFGIGLLLSKTETEKKRSLLLYLSLLCNIGLLVFFKYFNFFLDSFVSAFSFFGTELNIHSLQIILPVGISFYTFQTMSYTIDIYKRKIKPTEKLINFLAFVSFFPQLVAGPIERAANLLPQFSEKRILNYHFFSLGIKQIIFGFFLKLVVADRAALYVNAVYENTTNHEGLSFIFATILFAFQIYGDFAGYSLIAIGTAKLFGFTLMTNFRRPYFATSVSDFWTRWHISLSTWFRDYLYIPLGGNRVSKPRWLFNLFITFLISGLWHGANWTFLVWGALNGLYLILEVLLLKKPKKRFINILFTFILINISWIFFRANSISEAFYIINKILTAPGSLYIGSGDDITASVYASIAVLLLLFIELKKEYFNTRFSFSNNTNELVRMLTYVILILIILWLGVFGNSQFIYFQF